MPPAARVGDMHVCPMVTGIVPHVGGPILPPGMPTVLIGGMPAARMGDMCTCVGPPDVIAMGSPTVLIGNMMAARMGDLTAHGGSIVLGLPTVMIGEAGAGVAGGAAGAGVAGGAAGAGGAGGAALGKTGSVKWEKQPGATDEDLKKAQQMWEDAKARRLPDGSKPDTVKGMEALEASGKTTTIKVGPDGNNEQPENEANGMDPTKGTNTTIHFDPNKKGTMSDGTVRDPESSIAHEAYHSYQDITGTTPPTREQQEVAAAAAENQHRAAKGLPQRQKYGGEWDIPQYTPPAP